jgi:hypothetical protein
MVFWARLPTRTPEQFFEDLAAMRAAMIDLFYVMEGYMKGLIWIVSLPVRFLTALASVAVALIVLGPIVLLVLMACGETSGSALERDSAAITNDVCAWFGNKAESFAAGHPNTWLGRILIEGNGDTVAAPPPAIQSPTQMTLTPAPSPSQSQPPSSGN